MQGINNQDKVFRSLKIDQRLESIERQRWGDSANVQLEEQNS